MIKNTEVQYTAREAKLIAKILDAARSEFYKDEDDRSNSFRWFAEADIERFKALTNSYYANKVTSLALTLTEGEDD